jgi:hypothetical protein
MELWDVVRLNLLSPVVLAFALGMIAVWVRSDLKIPEAIYTMLSLYLLLAIGLKGGAELANVPLGVILGPAAAAVTLGVGTALVAYLILRTLGRFDAVNAAALAATYGSVSIVTFGAALTFLEAIGVSSERFMPTLVVLLEIPGIVVALALAQMARGRDAAWGRVMHEILSGKSVLLMVGGLVIGYLAGASGVQKVQPLFKDLFQGLVMLFLLEMGMVAARRLGELRRVGFFLTLFAVAMPIVGGFAGVLLGRVAGLSVGGCAVLGTLGGSASYIAAPSAARLALPEANPSFYLTASLAITFPFNLTVGIPLYYALARWVHGA